MINQAQHLNEGGAPRLTAMLAQGWESRQVRRAMPESSAARGSTLVGEAAPASEPMGVRVPLLLFSCALQEQRSVQCMVSADPIQMVRIQSARAQFDSKRCRDGFARPGRAGAPGAARSRQSAQSLQSRGRRSPPRPCRRCAPRLRHPCAAPGPARICPQLHIFSSVMRRI